MPTGLSPCPSSPSSHAVASGRRAGLLTLLTLILALILTPAASGRTMEKLDLEDLTTEAALAGFSVAVSGDLMLVGAPGEDNGAGAVYVFERLPAAWVLVQRLTVGEPEALFGWSIAIDGDFVLIGAPFANDLAGAVYVFEDLGGLLLDQGSFVAQDGEFFDLFGWSVALDGDTALVGAPFQPFTFDEDALQGAVYVFTRSGLNWSQRAKLVASDAAGAALLGMSVALEGTTALLGAPGAPGGGGTPQGAGYLFTRNGGSWSQQQKLTASGTSDLGTAVALEGATALLGAPRDDGAVVVFERTGTLWSEKQRLFSPNPGERGFGWALALDGNSAVVGVVGGDVELDFDDPSLTRLPSGSAHLLTRAGGTWAIEDRLTGDGASTTDGFGYSVGLSGDTVVVGAPGDSGREMLGGAFYISEEVGTPTGPCIPSATELCLAGDRFRVTTTFRTPQGTTGVGKAERLTPDTGYFWFFDATNVEMVVKVLDTCGFSGHFWVFAGGLTNVEVKMTVEDTESGESKIYQNPLRAPFQPIQDTRAFATCP